jgi:glycosyltransferase involved in cell wall biosynthesis
MNIAMMSAWNQTSGVSIHAELVGRKWIEQSQELLVFSFLETDFHGRSLVGQDEDYVIRCFGTRQATNFLDPIPFVENDYEIFVAQDINMIPMDKLAKIFPIIKRKAKTVHVVHESRLSHEPSFYSHEWDDLICFDNRFKDFLSRVYPEDRIHIIPFPCTRWNPKDKKKAREELDLPLDAKIVFVFGQKWRHIKHEEIEVLKDLSKKYDLLTIIISETQRVVGFDLPECTCIFKKEVLDRDRLQQYLHASDTWLFPKRSIDNFAVLSSTIHFAMGSGCIVTARDSNFLYGIKDTVLSYNTQEEFKNCLIEAFEEGDNWKRARVAAKRYSEEHESGKISSIFLKLFKNL